MKLTGSKVNGFQFLYLPKESSWIYLRYISRLLLTPIRFDSSREALAKATIPNEAAAHSMIYSAALRPQIKRAPWTPEEDATLLKMRNEGCSWEGIILKLLSYLLFLLSISIPSCVFRQLSSIGFSTKALSLIRPGLIYETTQHMDKIYFP